MTQNQKPGKIKNTPIGRGGIFYKKKNCISSFFVFTKSANELYNIFYFYQIIFLSNNIFIIKTILLNYQIFNKNIEYKE